MIRDIRVQARADYIASLSNATPLAALEELVWNALDADATEVKIDVIANDLGAVDAVRVSDNGTGVDIPKIDETFGGLGGSWKRGSGTTLSLKRRLHGRHGRGRFKAFAIGGYVEWRTTHAGPGGVLESHVISGDVEQAGLFRLEQAESGFATGTEVYITNIRVNADFLRAPDPVVRTLAAKFALYLKSYPGVRIYYCGIPVTPVIVQKLVTDYPVRLESGAEAKLEVIEWRGKFPGAGRLVLCGKDGFALSEQAAGVRPGPEFVFTAYLVAARLGELDAENMLVMDELNPEVRTYLDCARRMLRDHFRVRAAEEDAGRVSRWIEEGSYPFAADDASPEREAFDAGIADMRAHLDGFDACSAEERRYLFGLLRRAGRSDA